MEYEDEQAPLRDWEWTDEHDVMAWEIYKEAVVPNLMQLDDKDMFMMAAQSFAAVVTYTDVMFKVAPKPEAEDGLD